MRRRMHLGDMPQEKEDCTWETCHKRKNPTCVTLAGAQQDVQALSLNGAVRVHIHSYGGGPRLQTGLGQGTATQAASTAHSIYQ